MTQNEFEHKHKAKISTRVDGEWILIRVRKYKINIVEVFGKIVNNTITEKELAKSRFISPLELICDLDKTDIVI